MKLLLGDEAVGQAAIDSGIASVNGYPGTPSTEIFEYIEAAAKKDPGLRIHAEWAANEKVAYEQALGASYVGQRSLVTMKHVGLNVAADPFVNSALVGAKGGIVLCVADDPSMHSSQNEQDSRYYAQFAKLPCFEPATQQDCYDFTRLAFELSERLSLPVVVRMVTRLAHSRAPVSISDPAMRNPLSPTEDRNHWALLPALSRKLYDELLMKQALLEKESEGDVNPLVMNPAFPASATCGKVGVIVSGIAYNYFREVFPKDAPSHLKVGLYPAPLQKVKALLEACDTVCILEEGYPFLEQTLQGQLQGHFAPQFKGRLTGHLPMSGELSPDLVARSFASLGLCDPLPAIDEADDVKAALRPRPPKLCPGCPHVDTYRMIKALRESVQPLPVFGDIGCYTLGFYPPHQGIDACLCMGASISMAKGASDAGQRPVLAVIGDSTFGHSGLTGLLTAARENTPMTVMILDNSTTAMTGAQKSLETGDPLMQSILGLGVDPEHVKIVCPLPQHHEANVEILKAEVAYEGLSVVISRRACVKLRK